MQAFQISDFENTLTEKKRLFFLITRTETMEEDY